MRKLIKVKCHTCKKPFLKKASEIRPGQKLTFCSATCLKPSKDHPYKKGKWIDYSKKRPSKILRESNLRHVLEQIEYMENRKPDV